MILLLFSELADWPGFEIVLEGIFSSEAKASKAKELIAQEMSDQGRSANIERREIDLPSSQAEIMVIESWSELSYNQTQEFEVRLDGLSAIACLREELAGPNNALVRGMIDVIRVDYIYRREMVME